MWNFFFFSSFCLMAFFHQTVFAQETGNSSNSNRNETFDSNFFVTQTTPDSNSIVTESTTIQENSTEISSTTSTSQVSINPVIKYQDFGGCDCDLKTNDCDVNCCCDQDCSVRETSSFSVECSSNGRISGNNYLHRETCFDENLLVKNNSNLASYRLPSGSLCLIYDNNPQRLFYPEPNLVKNISEFDLPWKLRGLSNSIFPSPPLDAEILQLIKRNGISPVFKVGDPIFVIKNSDPTVRKLQLPASAPFSTRCTSFETLRFSSDTDSLCSNTVDNLAVTCTKNPLFQLNNFLNFSVIKSAEVFLAINASSGSLANLVEFSEKQIQDLTVPIQASNVFVWDTNGNVESVEFENFEKFSPIFSEATQICSNVVTQIGFTFYHNGSDVTQINMTLVLEPVSKSNGTFFVRFYSNFWSANTSDNSFLRSGNPGYLEGSTIFVVNISNSQFEENESIPANDLSVPGVDSSGFCDSFHQQKIKFGENTQMSCSVLVDVQNPLAACQILQDQLINAISNGGFLPTNVSVYGNGTNFGQDGWIPVSRDITSVDILFVPPNICRNIVKGLSIEIAYSKVGFLSHPQPKITGVLYRFMEPEDVVLECPFYGCTNGNLLPLELQIAVSFFDFSQSAVDLRSLQPPASRFLPADFFTPY